MAAVPPVINTAAIAGMQVDKFIYDRIWGRKERKEQPRENAPKSDPSLAKTVFTTIKDSTVGKVQHVFKKGK